MLQEKQKSVSLEMPRQCKRTSMGQFSEEDLNTAITGG